jgi:hypothetical protein
MAVVVSTNGRAATTFKTGSEIGHEGIEAFYGHVSETYLAKLEWPGVYDIYDEMRRRDPTLRGLLNAVKLLARQADWKAEPASDQPADREAADYLNECLSDMSHTVEDFLDDALTFLPFGWSSFEICYKWRDGKSSMFDDGRIGWRKLAFRRQSTLNRWEFDESGGLAGWWQQAAPDYADVFLPIEKLIHLVSERDGGNPEGLALFESAYEPWHYVKNLQIISGIGWQRSFVGLPVFEFAEKPSSEDSAAVKEIGQGLAVDDRQYISVPPGVTVKLESTANSNSQPLLETIKFYRTLMLQMVLADFMMLGTSSGTGSWALGSDKSELFLIAVNGYLDKIAAFWNRYGVARLFGYVDFPDMTGLPRMAHTDVHKPSWGELAGFINQIAAHIRMSDEDEIWIRELAGMPKMVPEEEPEDEGPTTDDEPAPTSEEPAPEPPEDETPEAVPEVAASEFFRFGGGWDRYG